MKEEVGRKMSAKYNLSSLEDCKNNVNGETADDTNCICGKVFLLVRFGSQQQLEDFETFMKSANRVMQPGVLQTTQHRLGEGGLTEGGREAYEKVGERGEERTKTNRVAQSAAPLRSSRAWVARSSI